VRCKVHAHIRGQECIHPDFQDQNKVIKMVYERL
jgi:hypothetical protein